MGAADVHLAKYISKYRDLYPTAQILLVKCPVSHMIFRARGRESVRPAVDVIRAAVDGDAQDGGEGEQKPELLVHLFSNGGSAVLSWLYACFAEAGSALPLHTTVFDSAPGRFTWATSYRAIVTSFAPGLTRWLAAPFVHSLCAAFWLLYIPWRRFGRRDPFTLEGGSHNDVTKVREKGRCYVYSDRDDLVTADMVEEHAADAIRKGWERERVRLEKFRGSGHVAHMKADPERYWRVVRETWEGGQR
jgi:hypothetical protein